MNAPSAIANPFAALSIADIGVIRVALEGTRMEDSALWDAVNQEFAERCMELHGRIVAWRKATATTATTDANAPATAASTSAPPSAPPEAPFPPPPPPPQQENRNA